MTEPAKSLLKIQVVLNGSAWPLSSNWVVHTWEKLRLVAGEYVYRAIWIPDIYFHCLCEIKFGRWEHLLYYIFYLLHIFLSSGTISEVWDRKCWGYFYMTRWWSLCITLSSDKDITRRGEVHGSRCPSCIRVFVKIGCDRTCQELSVCYTAWRSSYCYIALRCH